MLNDTYHMNMSLSWGRLLKSSFSYYQQHEFTYTLDRIHRRNGKLFSTNTSVAWRQRSIHPQQPRNSCCMKPITYSAFAVTLSTVSKSLLAYQQWEMRIVNAKPQRQPSHRPMPNSQPIKTRKTHCSHPSSPSTNQKRTK